MDPPVDILHSGLPGAVDEAVEVVKPERHVRGPIEHDLTTVGAVHVVGADAGVVAWLPLLEIVDSLILDLNLSFGILIFKLKYKLWIN